MYFGIGLGRTGTATLCKAFDILGFRAKHYPNQKDLRNLTKWDFVDDGCIPVMYEDLDIKYPDSKFIYTYRDLNSWIKSVQRLFGTQNTHNVARIPTYGTPDFNEKILRKRFVEHQEKVLQYFKDRPEDFITLNFSLGDGWEKLCMFLGVNMPDIPFPHLNKANYIKKT